jgi:FkbM family methyltransferase
VLPASRLKALVRAAGGAQPLLEALMPAALAEAVVARRVFERRGLARPSLLDARRSKLAGLHMLPADLRLDDALVVDVGANEGTFVQAVLNVAPRAQIIAVEPTPEPLGLLRQRFGSHPGVTIVPSALTADEGTVRMHVTPVHTGSSLLTPRPETGTLYDTDPAAWSTAQEVDVPATRLDTVVGDRDVALVKIDVQGGELGVLAGGEETLRRTRAILAEIVFVSHYEGDSPFPVLNRRMEQLGFTMRDVSDFWRNADGTAMYGDACFVRSS